MTHDYIVKALAFDGEIRAYAALTTKLFKKHKRDIIHGRSTAWQWEEQ